MHSKDCFHRLIQHLEAAELVASFRRDLVSDLSYFLRQSELELSLRDHPSIIREKWVELTQKTRGLGLFDEFEKNDLFWRTIKCFVFLEEPCTLIVPKPERPPESPSPYSKWREEDFFAHLSGVVASHVSLSREEQLILLTGLWFLESEASKARGRRKVDRIKSTWKTIQPLMDRLGIMDEFRKEKQLITQVKFFISDGVLG
ncbi:hypothetical protein [Bdellovibrio bacteriovorus]|uniref:hypothetical protein n=1 Tax=Bdellovibrio bacteriovorus TaxID=959 RepID=UPI003AA94097